MTIREMKDQSGDCKAANSWNAWNSWNSWDSNFSGIDEVDNEEAKSKLFTEIPAYTPVL